MRRADRVRDRVAALLGERRPFFAIAAVAVVLSAAVGGLVALAGLVLVLVALWARRWDWASFGAARPRWGPDLGRALKYTLLIAVVVDVVAQPLVDRLLGSGADLTPFDFLRGNALNLLLFTLFMWVVAAFGEEMFFRGYLMRGCARALGDGDRAWLAGALLSTVPFGLAHAYQGASGVVNTALVGALLALQFYRGRERLVSCMLTHGLYDMLGLVLIYAGRPEALARLVW